MRTRTVLLVPCLLVTVALAAPSMAQSPVVAGQESAAVAPAPPAPPAPPSAVPAPPAPPAPPARASSVGAVPATPAVPAAPGAVSAPAPPAVAERSVQAPAPTAAPAPATAPAPPAPRQKPPRPPAAPAAPPTPITDPEAPPEPPPAPLPPGRERIEADPVNIRFDVTISYQAGTAPPIRRTASLTVANNTGGGFPRSSLRSGQQVPVPTTTFTPPPAARGEEGKEPALAIAPPKPMVSYNYRSVGLNVDVNQAALVPGDKVRALLNVEFSGVDEKSASTASAPSFPNFSQSISLYLESGKPVLVAQSSDFVDNIERKQSVEVKATILR